VAESIVRGEGAQGVHFGGGANLTVVGEHKDTVNVGAGPVTSSGSWDKVKVNYRRTYLPKDEKPGHPNGEIAFSYGLN